MSRTVKEIVESHPDYPTMSEQDREELLEITNYANQEGSLVILHFDDYEYSHKKGWEHE